MTFIATDTLMGEVDLSIVDPVGPGVFQPYNGGPTSGRSSFYLEELRGYDPNLGAGVFAFAQFGAGVTAGTVVQFSPSLVNGKIIMTANPWAGAANSGFKLGVAVANGVAGQWGWFQVDGNAIVNVSGAPVAGNQAYWYAPGVVSQAAVASKQATGMTFATAPGVTIGQGASASVLNGQAIVTLCRPEAQGAIT